MRYALLLLAVSISFSAQAAPTNPCRNGSFEDIAPGGFPVDWAPLGKWELSDDAHSGKRSLRLLRTTEPPHQETGVNARNIQELKGGVDFSYKAISARDVVLHIYAIPMGFDGIENTGSMRAGFVVPDQHVGDGRWHQARLKYDFTENDAVKSVILAARLEGTTGELLLDDFSYLEQVGPLLRFGAIRLEEDPERPGRRCRVIAPIENVGDAAIRNVQITMEAPRDVTATPSERPIRQLAPDAKLSTTWELEGDRCGRGTLRVVAEAGDEQVTASLVIAPRIEIKSFGPVSPVAAAGQPVDIECILVNTGNAAALHPVANFVLDEQADQASADRIAPGSSVLLKTTFLPRKQSLAMPLSLNVHAGSGEPLSADSSLVVGAATTLPPPSGSLRVFVSDRGAPETSACAVLENEHVRLTFRKNQFGFGPSEIMVKKESHWVSVAWMPQLSRVVFRDKDETRHEHVVCVPATPQTDHDPHRPAQLKFVWSSDKSSPTRLRLAVIFELAAGARTITARYELQADEGCDLLALEGPMIYALARDEAVFPGLEWLVEDEVSSGTLDIDEGHPDRIRYVVHPNYVTVPAIGVHSREGTVGLLWDVHQKWDGQRDRPSAVFASPDRFENQRAHLMGLFLPTVPEFVKRNSREAEAETPYRVEPGRPLRLDAQIYADADAEDALAAIDQWSKIYGFPEPAPLPHGSYEKEIQFSMQGYLESLWVAEEKKWWTSKGGGMMSARGRPRAFAADLLLGEMLSPDADVRRQCRTRAEEVLALIGGESRLDSQRFPSRLDLALSDPSAAVALLASRDEDRAWRFDADQVGSGPFVGMDYHELGPDNAAELGTCAAKATRVLRYARITGDRQAYEQMLKTLEFMESFQVPRAAQVWEVPVHSPDILAAAEAVEAFLEAYRFSGDPRWLSNAVVWARRGLPFVYLWDDAKQPFLVGASIPVFGATWMKGSWFGLPVQWNGLRYAEAILELDEYDDSYPWRQIAAAVTHSAMHQQDTEGDNVALWPDNMSAVDSKKCAWVFTPRMILNNVLTLLDRDEDVKTVILGQGERRVHVNANATIGDASWEGSTCNFHVTYPPGEQGVVVVFNVARPAAVLLNEQPVAERTDVETGSTPGWRYEPSVAGLSIRVPVEGRSSIRIEGSAFRQGPRLPHIAEKIAFDFDDTLSGWIAAHDVGDLKSDSGHLVGRTTGPDPYLVRSFVRVAGDACPVIVIRLRVTAGGHAQFYWATESSQSIAEDKVIVLPIQSDGRFHEYRLETGKHALWAGQTITTLRLDPGNGAPSAEFAVDYIRAEK